MRKKIFFMFSALILICAFWVVYDFYHAAEPARPDFVDLSAVLEKTILTDDDYRLIFSQTGLGRAAVEDLRAQTADFAGAVKNFQMQIQEPVHYRQIFMFFPTTTAEVLKDEAGNQRALQLPPLRSGDILITRSTKTLLYRHGHCALVLNPDSGTVAEAMMVGTRSALLNIDSWLSYPTLLVLRPQAEAAETSERAVAFARQRLIDVPYRLLTGVVKKDKSDMSVIDGTHCAHLIWQSYRQGGIDLDSDGGWLVTPYDLSRCKELEVVFSYGFGE
ncbi:MAG: hypothetical protein ACI4QW_05445, partial [Clostridia bacterium]